MLMAAPRLLRKPSILRIFSQSPVTLDAVTSAGRSFSQLGGGGRRDEGPDCFLFDINPPRLAIKAPYLACSVQASRRPLKWSLQEAGLPAVRRPHSCCSQSLAFLFSFGGFYEKMKRKKKEKGRRPIINTISLLNVQRENPKRLFQS